MQLIILYQPNIILNDVDEHNTVLDIKNKIKNKLNISPEDQSLIYSGKNLDDDKKLADYEINNQSLIFLNNHLKGGFATNFPNIGHLFILIGISTMMLLFAYIIFQNVHIFFQDLPSIKECTPLAEIEANIDKKLATLNPLGRIEKSMKGGMINDQNFLYKLASMFYSSVIVIILTIYFYNMFCNEDLSNWLVIACLASLLLLFIVFIIIYRFMRYKYFGIKLVPKTIIYYLTILFTVLALILLALTFIIPAIKKSAYMHWTSYLYPIGVVLMTIVQYYLFKSNISGFLKVLAFVISSILLVFVPYSVAYVYNTVTMCK